MFPSWKNRFQNWKAWPELWPERRAAHLTKYNPASEGPCRRRACSSPWSVKEMCPWGFTHRGFKALGHGQPGASRPTVCLHTSSSQARGAWPVRMLALAHRVAPSNSGANRGDSILLDRTPALLKMHQPTFLRGGAPYPLLPSKVPSSSALAAIVGREL